MNTFGESTIQKPVQNQKNIVRTTALLQGI